jgi:putative transposase
MRLIYEQFLETPWYGSRQMARHLRRNGWCVGRHRVRRLMTKMGLAPIYQHPKTSEPHPRHKVYSYLLRHLTRAAEPCLVCRRDLHPDAARLLVPRGDHGLGKPESPGLATVEHNGSDFCVAALEEAIARHGGPEIFNTDQGSQFTSFAFTNT